MTNGVRSTWMLVAVSLAALATAESAASAGGARAARRDAARRVDRAIARHASAASAGRPTSVHRSSQALAAMTATSRAEGDLARLGRLGRLWKGRARRVGRMRAGLTAGWDDAAFLRGVETWVDQHGEHRSKVATEARELIPDAASPALHRTPGRVARMSVLAAHTEVQRMRRDLARATDFLASARVEEAHGAGADQLDALAEQVEGAGDDVIDHEARRGFDEHRGSFLVGQRVYAARIHYHRGLTARMTERLGRAETAVARRVAARLGKADVRAVLEGLRSIEIPLEADAATARVLEWHGAVSTSRDLGRRKGYTSEEVLRDDHVIRIYHRGSRAKESLQRVRQQLPLLEALGVDTAAIRPIVEDALR